MSIPYGMYSHILIVKLHTGRACKGQIVIKYYSPFYGHGCHSETGHHKKCVIDQPDTLTEQVSPQPDFHYAVQGLFKKQFLLMAHLY